MIEIEIKYEAGHSYAERYEQTELFCPGCGVKGLWDEQGGGDYYVGENFVCTSCGAVFTMQFSQGKGWQDEQRLEKLSNKPKEGKK